MQAEKFLPEGKRVMPETRFTEFMHYPLTRGLRFLGLHRRPMTDYYCTARQCSLLRRKFMVCSIIQIARSILMKHLVIGQRQKIPNFSAFHWSLHGRMVSIGQHFVSTRVVHLPKRVETSLITKSDRFGPIR